MKLQHTRWIKGELFCDVTHYYEGDLAKPLAAKLRRELGCKARVIKSNGYEFVFVPERFLDDAIQKAEELETSGKKLAL